LDIHKLLTLLSVTSCVLSDISVVNVLSLLVTVMNPFCIVTSLVVMLRLKAVKEDSLDTLSAMSAILSVVAFTSSSQVVCTPPLMKSAA